MMPGEMAEQQLETTQLDFNNDFPMLYSQDWIQ